MDIVMSSQRSIQSMEIAARVADYLADRGYACVEDDQLEGLDEVLIAFLQRTGIPVQAASDGQERRWPLTSGTPDANLA